MGKTVNKTKVPTISRFFSALCESYNVLDDLVEVNILDEEPLDLYGLYSDIISDFLDNKHIALTVAEEYRGKPLAYDIYVFDEAEPCRAYVEATVKGGKTCKAITTEELKKTALFEWPDPFCYSVINDGFAILHTEID